MQEKSRNTPVRRMAGVVSVKSMEGKVKVIKMNLKQQGGKSRKKRK